jgi:hypothetical protein
VTNINVRWASFLTVAAMMVAGCSTVVDGDAVRAAGGPPPGTVDVALLNPGNYSTKPLPPIGAAGSPFLGAILDAQRMADFVVGAWEVDPALTASYPFGYSGGAMAIKRDALEVVITDEAARAGARHNFINGFVAARQVERQKILFNSVLRMADPQSATAAAPEMAAGTIEGGANATVPKAISPIPIPGHPEAFAVTYSFPDYGTPLTWHVVESFTAHGPYVLAQKAQSTENVDVAAGLVAKAIDLQAPRIDQFAPTDPAQFPTLARDPSGLLAKALPVPPDATTVNNNATFGQYGALHYMIDPATAAKVFADAGMDTAVSGDDWVLRSRDAAGAAAVAEDAVKQVKGSPADPVPNMPGSRCLSLASGNGFWCVGTADRYEFEVSSAQLRDVHHRMAAQYILLTAK